MLFLRENPRRVDWCPLQHSVLLSNMRYDAAGKSCEKLAQRIHPAVWLWLLSWGLPPPHDPRAGAAYPEAIPTWQPRARPSPPGRHSGSAPGEDRAPPRPSRSQRGQGQPLPLPVCFQGGCLCCCSEQEAGGVLQPRRCDGGGLEDT